MSESGGVVNFSLTLRFTPSDARRRAHDFRTKSGPSRRLLPRGRCLREIVPEAVWRELATDQGRDAVLDRRLYNRIFRSCFLEQFEQFCCENNLPCGLKQEAGPAFDARAYARDMAARRDSITQWVRQKPHVVILDGRFFSFELLSESEIRVFEFEPEEVAETMNEMMRKKSLRQKIADLFRR